ncbi:E3 ubiquitin/ISG15 ligase TRIM25-like [Hyperolius riggenbachi]|uniref:E3 ubiquitin/ISG15 ligase TRIM25-like n=1 Tax=Hyperolius riggenbachi TaxID=752182 RepID=UPI0035A33D08
MASADLKVKLNCYISLDKCTEPASTKRGHSLCQSCIDTMLNSQQGCGIYSCPECRTEYPERPLLAKNRHLRNRVEHSMMTHLVRKKSSILCTYCDFTEPAVKMCLQCETALCGKHLSHHNETVDHPLTDPSISMEHVKCPAHNKVINYYCSEDETCICVSCFANGDHRGHLVRSIDEVLKEEKQNIEQLLEKITCEKAGMEKSLQKARNHVAQVEKDAALITKKVGGFFEEIQEKMNVLKKTVVGEINRQAKEIRLQVSDLIQKMETKENELSQSIDCIQDVCNREVPFSVLCGQTSPSLFKTEPGNDKTSHPIGDLNKGVFSNLLHTGLWDIVVGLQKDLHLGGPSPLMMDANTAHRKMALSADLKTAADSCINYIRPESPSRFILHKQALSVNSFTEGQHYWEVKTSTTGMWDVGLAYPSIKRDGDRSGIGYNNKSWCLRKYTKRYMAAHNSRAQSLLMEQSSQIIGIYLDYEAGKLSFYELFDPCRSLYRHIHTFTATFTEPLHAAVYVDDGAWVTVRH